jgi:hypothetical protein
LAAITVDQKKKNLIKLKRDWRCRKETKSPLGVMRYLFEI